jgi:hypothetical protein
MLMPVADPGSDAGSPVAIGAVRVADETCGGGTCDRDASVEVDIVSSS